MPRRSSNGEVVKLAAVRAKRAGHGIYVDSTGSGSGAAFTVGDAFADDVKRERRRKRAKKPHVPA